MPLTPTQRDAAERVQQIANGHVNGIVVAVQAAHMVLSLTEDMSIFDPPLEDEPIAVPGIDGAEDYVDVRGLINQAKAAALSRCEALAAFLRSLPEL